MEKCPEGRVSGAELRLEGDPAVRVRDTEVG